MALVRRCLGGGPLIAESKADEGWKKGQATLNMRRKTCFMGRKTCSASCFSLSPMDTIKIRADCKYDKDELAAILPYRSSFISGTIAERITILKRDILTAMFNHWLSLGKVYNPKKSKALTKV